MFVCSVSKRKIAICEVKKGMSDNFTSEQLSARTFKVVENDKFGQYPFLYVINGVDKCIVIDTGCGINPFKSYVNSKINTTGKPILVINTHVHFDHIGGNHEFSGNSLGIYMGSRNKTFTQNFEINSLALAHNGAKIKPFEVTRWLNEGDLIYLDDSNQSKDQSLEVIFTPGHTPDSISLFAHFESRLFVGDTLYPFTAIHLDCLGSNVNDYVSTLQKLVKFVEQASTIKHATGNSNTTISTTTSTPQSKITPAQQTTINTFLSVIGLTKDFCQFDLEQFLQLNDWNAELAVDMFLSNPSEAEILAPLRKPPSTLANALKNKKVNISCGHVEANLDAEKLQEVLDIVTVIKAGALPPTSIDESGYAEYNAESFTLIIPVKELTK